jgi:hypothetical protein
MKRVKCFGEELAKYGPYATLDAGLRVIEVRLIRGSVDKCRELDSRFRTRRRRDRGERWRRSRFDGQSLQFRSLPPIAVYLLGGEYYVIDGNRRVAAAKRFGLEFMDAHVTECVPHGDRDARQGAVSRRLFEQQTGLKNVRLSYSSGYADLLEEAKRYRGSDDPVEGARLWYSSVFLPRLEVIASSEMKKRYEGFREGDLYVLIIRFFRDLMDGMPEEVDFDTALSAFLFAHRMQRKPLFRRFPIRQLYSLLRGPVPASLQAAGEVSGRGRAG